MKTNMNDTFDIIFEKYKKVPNIEIYIKERNYNIDEFSYKILNYIIKHDLILIDDYLIEWIGYEYENIYDMRKNFIKLLKADNIIYNSYKYSELIEYVNNNPHTSIILPEKTKNIDEKNFIIMKVFNFSAILMDCFTKKGIIAKFHYMDLENIEREYAEFCGYCIEKELTDVRNKLKIMKKKIFKNTIINLDLENKKQFNKINNLLKKS